MESNNEKLHFLNGRMRFFIDDQRNHVDGLKYMRQCMNNEMLPVLKTFYHEASEYRILRDTNNIEMVKLMNREYEKITLALSPLEYVSTQIMSSIGAKLNLAEADSDIDIGILVKDLNINSGTSIDTDKFNSIVQILTSLDFEFSHIFNPDNFSNQYYSFQKVINGVEFEAKIRDFDATFSILALHNYLDTQLSDDEITLFTFAKYLFKQFDKQFPGSKSYVKFKKILYEWAFACVKGGFIFADPTL